MKTRSLLILVLILILAGSWFGFRSRERPSAAVTRPAGQPAMAVDTTTVITKTVPQRWHALGQVEAFRTVSIRPQASGVLKDVLFHEGDAVKQGQLLFRIDPATYQAAVAQAQAQLNKDRATLANARWQEERQQRLQGQRYSSAQDYENAKALVAETEATVALDEAQLKQARIQLDYCDIRSPIDGYTGALSIKAGNLVQAADSTPLVTIRQISPALVSFSIPQGELEKVRAARATGNLISVRLTDATSNAPSGSLVFVDNSMDSKTGTILLKARFDNADGRLWPGQYVDLDLISGEQKNAIVIPETALQQGQDGPFVFIVRDGRAHVQTVVSDRQIGRDMVIEKGLKAGDIVITRVPRRLEDGSSVTSRASAED